MDTSCTHNQYRCDHRNNIYDYYSNYNDSMWGCINSTLACNGELDCRFDRSDEQGCGMLEMILLPLELVCIKTSSHSCTCTFMYYPLKGGLRAFMNFMAPSLLHILAICIQLKY